MLYLEAPVGVGFSYSDDKSDYKTNDDQTALDNVEAMNSFFDAFPKVRHCGSLQPGQGETPL